MEWVATGIYPFVGLMRWIIPSIPIKPLPPGSVPQAQRHERYPSRVAAAFRPDADRDHIAGQRVFDLAVHGCPRLVVYRAAPHRFRSTAVYDFLATAAASIASTIAERTLRRHCGGIFRPR